MYDYSEEITNYLYNHMSDLQREAFEYRMVNDKDLAAEVRRQQEMLDVVKAKKDIEEAKADPHYDKASKLSDEILAEREQRLRTGRNGHNHKQDIAETGRDDEKVRRLKWRRPLAIAVSIAIFFLIRYLPFETKAMKRLKQTARANMGIKPNLSGKFGRFIGRNIAKLKLRFRK